MEQDHCAWPSIAYVGLAIEKPDTAITHQATSPDRGRIKPIQSDCSTRFHTLPVEIIFWIMDTLPPQDILALAQVSTRLRALSLSQLSHLYDMRLDHICSLHGRPMDATDAVVRPQPTGQKEPMSDFELYMRIVSSEFYYNEREPHASGSVRDIVAMALNCSQRILRRLYLLDRCNDTSSDDGNNFLTPPPIMLNPFVTSTENLHTIARVIADQVCRGICPPETAVLILQSLTSLRDQDHFQYLVINRSNNARLRMPQEEDFVSLGVLCLKYLVLGILSLLNPSLPSTRIPENSAQVEGNKNNPSPLQTKALSVPDRTQWSDHARNLANGILASQRDLLNPIHIHSIQHLTRVLCFLPLLGRHFNNLPTSTFIDTFLDRSEGDLPIDRAAVMVYGFICVLDLETGKANFASESYKIFERSMPTHGVVQAQEIIRIVERHRWLMRGFLLSSPTFSSSRLFGDDAWM